ncbi:MAG TPA: alpha-ketoglutarate-dependent dioxygenase AlkB [Microvirga sp.]|jgi:alkylated DNA repair protein (DNA oxidative demethylase)|nr:alpha-ketoglutarate-dependent dioxygenase AlkB [Microvirga sp.]
MLTLAPGLTYAPDYLDRAGQERLLREVLAVLAAAPPFTPRMPRTGKPFSVRMTNCGRLGWVSDERGYRYQAAHPETGRPWPPIPETALAAWAALSGYPDPPDACLVNLYGPAARMGLHQDRDEEEFDAPVVSLSLGDTAIFRIGGLERRDPTRSIRLRSGDAVAFGGPSRLIFHGVDRLVPGASDLMAASGILPEGGRVNLTLRKVTRGGAGAPAEP